MNARRRKQNTPCRKVLICGAYGAGNIGDEAILSAIIGTLRGFDPTLSLCVVTRSPEITGQKYGVEAVHTFDFVGIFAAMKNAGLYINGGGSLIQNVTSRRSLFYYLGTLRLAKLCGCRVLMYGCGIGPISGKGDIKKTAGILNSCVDAICVRDKNSAGLLNDMGVTKPEIILAADPVLSLSACSDDEAAGFLLKNGIDPEGNYACFCLRPWQGLNEHFDAVLSAIRYAHNELGLTPVFMTLNRKADFETAQRAVDCAEVPCVILPAVGDAALCMGLMKKMRIVVSMRMHAVLFAAGCGVPTVGISYDPKVAGFMEYTECGECIELENLTGDALILGMKRELSRADNSERERRMEKIKAVEALNGKTAARYIKGERITE